MLAGPRPVCSRSTSTWGLTKWRGTVNYIDSTYTAAEAHKRYYPTHSTKLKTLKDKYDPKRVINFPHDF